MKKERYDVLVIGAGAGGLTAAAFLAKAGYRVIILERLPFVGGRGSSLKHKKGFEVATGAAVFELGMKEDIFDPLGVPFQVRVPEPNSIYWIDGEWQKMPEKSKLRSAITIASGEEEADKIMKAIKRAIIWQEPSDKISLRDWLLQYTDKESTINCFVPSWQVEEAGAGGVMREIRTMRSMDYGHAIGGLRKIWEGVADSIKSNGGEIWTQAIVRKILIEGGVAKGVVATKNFGKKSEAEVQIDAQAVISNIGPYGTINLGGKENFDKAHIIEVRETIRKPFPWLAIQLASSAPLVPTSSVGFIVGARIVNMIICPTIINPEVAPEGKHITYIGAWIPPEPPWDFNKYLEAAMKDFNDIAPDYEKYGEGILHVGYFVGHNWPAYHSYNGHSLSTQKTSVENLYNVGDAVFPPGYCGMWGCALSGKIVASDLGKRIKPI